MADVIEDLGFRIDDLQHISGRDFISIPVKEAILLDVRPDYELSRLFDVDNIIYCQYREIELRHKELPRDVYLVVADAVGLQSKEIAVKLLALGFIKVCNLPGGIVEWERDGLPVTLDKSRILTGSCMCQLKVRKKK
ncbi:MAG: rhodanese-like domain-containing protein [Bacteroidales bacterium]|nr:rhodanese-like domain-containing protein [Bacteroidales bacterium]